jgi:hypothetical protein
MRVANVLAGTSAFGGDCSPGGPDEAPGLGLWVKFASAASSVAAIANARRPLIVATGAMLPATGGGSEVLGSILTRLGASLALVRRKQSHLH